MMLFGKTGSQSQRRAIFIYLRLDHYWDLMDLFMMRAPAQTFWPRCSFKLGDWWNICRAWGTFNPELWIKVFTGKQAC